MQTGNRVGIPMITYSIILGIVILLLAVFMAKFSSGKPEASKKRDD